VSFALGWDNESLLARGLDAVEQGGSHFVNNVLGNYTYPSRKVVIAEKDLLGWGAADSPRR
jgi:hypothetical protein